MRRELIMNKAYIATAIAFRDLHCDSINTIDERILLQKKIFLAQDLGLPLGYGYNWYIHGPYSSDLTTVAYQIIPEGFESIEKNTFKKKYSDMIKKVNDLESDITSDNINLKTVQWYELIASIAYWYERGIKKEDDIVEKIKTTKPQFTTKQTVSALKSYKTLKSIF